MTHKQNARKKFLQKRKLEVEKKGDLICQQVEFFLKELITSNTFNKKLHIGIYWPLPGEVDLTVLKKVFNLQFALPFSNSKGDIQYRRWALDHLEKDFYGIPSPTNEPILSPKEIALIFVPAIAIDKNGNRLGYGGGCFDRLRQDVNWQIIPSFVVLPKACVSDSPLPFDSWDIPFEGWITENGQSKRNTHSSKYLFKSPL